MASMKLEMTILLSLLLCGPRTLRAAGFFQIAQGSANTEGSSLSCPGLVDINRLLATASSQLEKNEFAPALNTLQRGSALRCDYRVSLLLAAAHEGAGNTLDAEEVLRQASALWPTNTSVGTSLARYYLRSGDPVKAEIAIKQCKPSASTPLRELQMMAMVYLQDQDLTRAKSISLLTYRQYPSEETLLFLANVLQLQGRYMDVVNLLQKERVNYPDSAPFLVTIAESEYDGTMYAPARKDLELAAKLDPKSYPAHYLLGNVLVKTGDMDGAINEYLNAIRISPKQPRTYYQLGLVFEKEAKYVTARSEFNKAISVDINYAAAYCELGKLDLRSNQLQSAAINLKRAMNDNPSLQESYFLLVQTYSRMGEKDKSRQVMEQWTAYKNSHRLRLANSGSNDSSHLSVADQSNTTVSGPS
jgi:tetratricopeptide (TPR) repeat protein